jgi:prevent-host-death family protein
MLLQEGVTMPKVTSAPVTFTSRAFNQDTGKAKKAAERGPVIITDRGEPSHVLLSFSDYTQLTQKRVSIADLLYYPGAGDIEFELPEGTPYTPQELDLL